MESLNGYIKEYIIQLKKGQVQKAYKGIMTFMTGLENYLERRYPEYKVSALYFGYMDMTYFAFTPIELKKKNLKIAVLYLHEQNRFEVWLGAINRKIQAEYIELIRSKDIGHYKLSQALPGTDSILELQIVEQPDFDCIEELKLKIEAEIMKFIDNVISILSK